MAESHLRSSPACETLGNIDRVHGVGLHAGREGLSQGNVHTLS